MLLQAHMLCYYPLYTIIVFNIILNEPFSGFIQARFYKGARGSVKAVIMAYIADLANYPVRFGLRSGDRFLFKCVFAALSNVANYKHICWFLEPEAFKLESTHFVDVLCSVRTISL